jgi:hypothetical protein
MKGGVPRMDSFMKIAEAAGVSVEWLATGEGAALRTQEQPGTYESPEIKGLTLEDVQAIVTIVEGSSLLKSAPLEERARAWMELINSQLRNRARLRAEAQQMLKEGPPQPD